MQSVCTKLIVEQEEKINKFESSKYYKTDGYFDSQIIGDLNKNFDYKKDVEFFLEHCKNALFTIEDISKKKT